MHEAGLIRDLMAKVLTLAEQEGAQRVASINVWLGALSHMSPGHFREHFEMESAGSIVEHAALEIETSDDVHHPQAQSVLLRGIDVVD